MQKKNQKQKKQKSKTPGSTGSVLGLVGLASVCRELMRLQVWSAASVSVFQHAEVQESVVQVRTRTPTHKKTEEELVVKPKPFQRHTDRTFTLRFSTTLCTRLFNGYSAIFQGKETVVQGEDDVFLCADCPRQTLLPRWGLVVLFFRGDPGFVSGDLSLLDFVELGSLPRMDVCDNVHLVKLCQVVSTDITLKNLNNFNMLWYFLFSFTRISNLKNLGILDLGHKLFYLKGFDIFLI